MRRVQITSDAVVVTFADGRVVTIPRADYPRLAAASDYDWYAVTVTPCGLHWEALDEDISFEKASTI